MRRKKLPRHCFNPCSGISGVGTYLKSIDAGDSGEYNNTLPRYLRQAGHAGWGWTLGGLGSIQVVNGSSHEAYLNFPGGSQKLTRPTNGDAWSWQSDPQTFIRVNSSPSATAKNATKWTVYSKDGLRYTFGADNWEAQSVAFNRDITFNCSSNATVARQLYLTEIRDPHDNYIQIQYQRDERELDEDICDGAGLGSEENYIRDTRPVSVTYYAAGTTAQPTAQIEFRYGSRVDYGIEKWDDDYVQSLYSDKRLEGIEVSVLGASGFEPSRKYTLAYAYTDFPNLPNTTDVPAQLMTLVSITDQGKTWNDASALPSYTFTYTQTNGSWVNTTALYTAGNGYGGEVEYHYRTTGNFEIDQCNPDSLGGEELTTHFTSRYFVDRIKTFDGLSSAPVQTVLLNATMPYAVASSSNNNFPCTRDFEFGGYALVSREVQNSTGVVLQRGETQYYQTVAAYPNRVAPQAGKPRNIKVLTPANVLLTQEILTWTATSSLGTPWVALKTKLSEVSGSPAVTNRVEYTYTPMLSTGFPYGLPQQVAEYANGTLYRKTETQYVEDNVALRFLVVPRQVKQMDANNNCLGITLFAYDNGNNYSTTPTLGKLTASKAAQTNCSTGPWLESRFGYDEWGNQTTITNPRNYTTTTAFDTSGAFPRLYAYPITMTLPNVTGGTFRTVYEWNKYLGQVEHVVDKANGITLQNYTYDEFGRVKETTDPASGRIKYVYPPTTSTLQLPYRVQVHTLLDVTAPGTWQYQHHFYDGLGRGIEVRTSYQGAIHTVAYTKYHALGGVEYAYAPIERAADTTYIPPDQWNGQPYTYTKYDALGRPIAVRATDNTTTTMSYGTATFNNRALHLQTVQDPRGTTIRQYSDALGRMTAVQEMTGTNGSTLYATTLYTYTVTDLLDQVKDQAGNITDMNYDLLGRKTSMDDPDMGYWQYAYDANSNLIAQLDANYNGVCFHYDALNRVTRKRVFLNTSLPNTQACLPSGFNYEATYQYDADTKGLRSSMSDPTGSTTWDYTLWGQLLREDKTILHNGTPYSFATSYQYDQIGRVEQMKYMPGLGGEETVNYDYDAPYIGTLSAMTSNVQTYMTGMQYNRHGQITAMTYGTSTPSRLSYSYHPLAGTAGESQGRLSQSTLTDTNGTLWVQQYEYDVVGNIEKIDNYRPNQDYQETLFAYDPLNRLITAQSVYPGVDGAYNESYRYNAIGNMTQRNGINYTYSTSQPHAVVSLSNNKSYVYDANGNQTRRRYYNGVGTQFTDTLSYDGENRLTSIVFGDSLIPSANYAYDGDGNRVKAIINGQTTLYVGGLMEYRVADSTLVKYYYAGSQRIAMREGSDASYFFVGDHLGSTSITLDQDGDVYSEMRYKPFGETAWSSTTDTPTQRRYTGQLQDFDMVNMQLYFYNARYYDPELGRFTQADTIVPQPDNPQTLNRFSYVNNNPIIYTDPKGHFTEDAIANAYRVEGVNDIWGWNEE
jgi:RHS repeat-associated protein